MGFKDWIFINENEEKKGETAQVPKYVSKFPTAAAAPNSGKQTSFTPESSTPTPVAPNCTPEMEKVMEMYDKGFEKLNQPGYDFFEFFKAISAGDNVNNPQMYKMAYDMAKAMDSTVTKEKLLNQAEFYVNEINKVYNGYVSAGTTKKSEQTKAQANEKQSLMSELARLNKESAEIQARISVAENSLTTVDAKYKPSIDEIECKLMANEVAKDTILNSINTVKAGISNNIN